MTSTETRGSWSDRISPRNWSLAWKLVAVGLVPALLAIVLGVLRVADQAHTASELGAANRLLEVRGQVADAATALRVERDRATTFLAERRLGDRAPLQDAVRNTDVALDRFRSGVPAAADLDQATRSAFEQAQGGFAQLSVLRSQVNGTATLLPADIMQSYTGVVARTDVLDRALLRQVRIPDVAGLVDALTAATAGSEALQLQHTVLGSALRVGTVSAADRAAINATDNAFAASFTEYQVALPATQAPINFVTSRPSAQRDADKATILSAPAPGPISLTVDQWDTDSRAAAEQVDTAGATVAKALVDAGTAAETRSSNLAGLNSVLLMLGVLVAATIVVLMSRSLTRSLRVLRTSALEIAGRRLPQAVEAIRSGNTSDVVIEPVPLHTRDEIGEVARAFDEVHDQALRLAVDQAALQSSVSNMFVNLSRRSQGLVERQLQLIEQLESNEQDPDQLSNLFQLDHLATRMRRNSENLLVLAGTDFAKRNVAPVPLVDVLRAAVSEIEHYQRVVVQAPPKATLVGRSTSDVVHLLAELLDNATSFSPPDSQVVISSHRAGDGSILVEIADRGVGMPDQELVDANRRLSTPSAVDVSASRRMGLYVVGRLGIRHGIAVHLGGSPMGGPGGGLTASVTLPAHLVVSGAEGGTRPPRPDTAPTPSVPTTNGVPPQRAGHLGRPTPRAALAAPSSNGQALAKAGGLNGLPTRTPGSSLRRDLVARSALSAEPDTTAQPVTTADRPEQAPGAPFPVPAQPGSRAADTDLQDLTASPDTVEATPREHGGADDSAPTGAVPNVGAATDGPVTDDAATTPPSGRPTERPRPAGSSRRTFTATPGEAPSVQGPAGADETAETAAVDVSAASGVGSVAETAGAATGSTTSGSATEGADGVGPAVEAPHELAARDDDSDDDGEADARDIAARDTAAQDTAAEHIAAQDVAAQDSRPASPRPRPTPRGTGPNGTRRDAPVPSAPYEAYADGAQIGGGQNDGAPIGQNGAANGAGQHGPGQHGPGQHATDPGGGLSPQTTPFPVVPGLEAPVGVSPFATSAAEGYDAGADALFSASVPAIAEPDGLPNSRRPLGDLRQGPADITETTPIFEEIASAWFASQRPVPVDWELGERPGAEPGPADAGAVAPEPAPAAGALWPDEAPTPSGTPVVPATVSTAQAFASAADEGWRAASGAAAERPDELTAAGLPKRRPRARLVPGSAGSAVLAAPASPTRSAESIRGRLASYQQGVRQGREIRLRRDPGGAGAEPEPTDENIASSRGDEHDVENR